MRYQYLSKITVKGCRTLALLSTSFLNSAVWAEKPEGKQSNHCGRFIYPNKKRVKKRHNDRGNA
ncbi:MAG: hypothetical protein KAH20_12755 [Methylococcales bacterium]|nr:hypothetical protein [Methylococcales bacterium]